MSMLTSAPISALAVELLHRELVLAGTVLRVPGSEYSGPSGGSVTLRVPQQRTARVQARAGAQIDLAAVDESAVTVTVKHVYDAAPISDWDMRLTVEDFGRQILVPQVEAVARAAEDEIAAAMNSLTPDDMITWPARPDDDADADVILAVRERMTEDGIPLAGRWCAVSPSIARRLLNNRRFVEADKRGSSTALDQAVIGSLYGITFVESAAIEGDTAVFYARSGFALGTCPPVAPAGVSSAVATANDIALRHVLAYDVNVLSSVSVVSVFVGAAVVPEDGSAEASDIRRAIKIELGGS